MNRTPNETKLGEQVAAGDPVKHPNLNFQARGQVACSLTLSDIDMHKLLNNGWDYIQESYSDVSSRYKGFGYELFDAMSSSLPQHYQTLKFYRSTSNQTEDVFAICEGLGHDYGIQLDPDCEVICLWDGITHIEIGYWSEDEYVESIKFIKTNFQQ